MTSSAPRCRNRDPVTIATRTLRAPLLRPDDRLAELAAAGDERAFEVVYDRHHRALLGFCRHMVGSRDEAEDALQQTFLRAHRALVEHGPPDDLRPWLFTIARNRCLTLLAARRAGRRGRRPAREHASGLGEEVQARADLRAVVADVERLPDEQRAALVLAELADLSHDQIGEVIGVRHGEGQGADPPGADDADRRARRARAAVRGRSASSSRPRAAACCGAGRCAATCGSCAPCRAYRDAVADQRARARARAAGDRRALGLKAGVLGAASAGGARGGRRRRWAAGWPRRSSPARSSSARRAAVAPRSSEPPGACAAARPSWSERPPPRRRRRAPPRRAPRCRRRVVATPKRRAERRRVAGTRGRKVAKARRERAKPPGQSRRALAHARAPGQQKKVAKAPGSSRSVNAPPKKAKPVKPAKPVKAEKPARLAKPAKPVTPVAITPAEEKRATALPKLKQR